MHIPDIYLLAFAGIAQIHDGTSKLSYIFSYGDDPKDQARILQGIEKYNADNMIIKPADTDNDIDT